MRVLVCAVLLAAAAASPLDSAFPRPQGYVNDFAGVIDATTAAELERLVRETETKTSAEIAVVTVKSLDGMSIEEYAAKLFAEWGIGKKSRDNGVLVLVAPNERRMRIEVGYGLEPILPDSLAGRIIRKACLPLFRQDQFALGILAGVKRVAAVIEQREVPPIEPQSESQPGPQPERGNAPATTIAIVAALGLFIAVGSLASTIGIRQKASGAPVFGAVVAGIPFVVGLFNCLFWTLVVLFPLGIVMAAAGDRLGKKRRHRHVPETTLGIPPWALDESTRIGSREGLSGGSSGGSSGGRGSVSGSGGSSGGGFGGGSSGGGGATGSW